MKIDGFFNVVVRTYWWNKVIYKSIFTLWWDSTKFVLYSYLIVNTVFIMDIGALDELRTDLFLLGTELYNELIVLVFAIETGSWNITFKDGRQAEGRPKLLSLWKLVQRPFSRASCIFCGTSYLSHVSMAVLSNGTYWAMFLFFKCFAIVNLLSFIFSMQRILPQSRTNLIIFFCTVYTIKCISIYCGTFT